MRVPPFERYRGGLRGAAVFACGMIVGAAIYNGIFQFQVSQLDTINSDLKTQIKQHEEEIESLKQYKNQHTVIHNIQIYIEHPDEKDELDPITENEIKLRLKKDLNIFRGRNIFKINNDANFARHLIEGKIYTSIQDKDFKISIKTMLVNDGLLQIWVEAAPYTRRS